MKIATWNVNSIKMRAEQVVSWLTSTAVDVLVMQETKTTDDAFPASLFEAAGYDVVFDGQKTYNGVAMAVKRASQRFPASPAAFPVTPMIKSVLLQRISRRRTAAFSPWPAFTFRTVKR